MGTYPPRHARPREAYFNSSGLMFKWQEFDVLGWFRVGDVLQSVGEPLFGIEVVETTGGKEAVVHGNVFRRFV